jgi:hypothetical protein
MRGQQKLTKIFDTIDICNKLTSMEKVGGVQTTRSASALIFIRLSECGLMCNALEIKSKAVLASGDVLFLRSSLD